MVNSRELTDAVRRRRECLSCRHRYTTFERIESAVLMVVKRDGRREEFDRHKLFEGIRKACHKRPISVEQIGDVASSAEHEVRGLGLPEVESYVIGEIVMSRLRLLDDIAYVRFASVYRRFADVESFMSEVEDFRGWKRKRAEERAQLKLPV